MITSRFLIFFSAAFLLAISPGPGMLYVLARSLKGGKKVGLASSFGTALGGMGHVIAAAFGISAILAQSAYAFLFVKYLGAAYLAYLGIRTLFSGDGPMLATVDEVKKAQSPFWQGVLTEVLNPKTALFFLAFIPQFVDHAAPLLPQFILLGATSVALNTSADLAVVLAAAPLAKRLETSILWRKRQRQVSGAALVGLGSYVAVS
ncbi:MAG TPA: LysE family translocator [Terriglobales bacterium]|nr:LysE family translocator [Terriglobales bacterium]